ncbi:MAG: pitrilysin family protein [Bacteroidota bacterium]
MQEILDRSSPPRGGILNKIPLPTYEIHTLSNGISVYLLPFGSVEVVEVQAIFRAGKVFQPEIGVASYAASNMREGTASYSSLQLAQLLDGYGAWLNHSVGEEDLAFKLATVSKHLSATLPLLKEVIMTPTFPKDEFAKMKARALQKMSVNEEKTSYLAGRNFKHQMYGTAHPYGMHLGRAELTDLSLDQLVAYHEQYLQPGNFCLTVVGNYDKEKILTLLEQTFGTLSSGQENLQNSPAGSIPIHTEFGTSYLLKAGMQASLRLGHPGIKRKHPDFDRMLVVNTLLGGFFGSRLMKNIREAKGYTYGIYSGWISMKQAGHFVVQSEVGNEYIHPTIQEIKLEMRKLMEEGATEEELQLVKNYLLGRSVSQRETLFQIGDILRFSIVNEISFDEIDRKFDIIQHMQPHEVGELASKYFKPDKMVEVIVGELSS